MWDEVYGEYSFRTEDEYWWFAGRRDLALTLIHDWIATRESPRILDIGCGTGATARDLRRYGEVTACDLALLPLQYCRRRGLDELVVGDVLRLPFRDGSFDLAVALDLLEHVGDDIGAVRELHRVLKPGGRLVITVPAYQALWSNHDLALKHVRRYTARELRGRLLRAGFRVRKLSYAMTFLFLPAAISRILSKMADRGKKPEAFVTPVSPAMNRLLTSLEHIEARLIHRVSLPFGLTVAAVVEKD